MITKKITFSKPKSGHILGKAMLSTLVEYRVFGLLIYKKELVSPQETITCLPEDFEFTTHL